MRRLSFKEASTLSAGVLVLFIGGAFAFVTLYAPGDELARASIDEEVAGAITFKMPDSRVELFAEIDLVMEDPPRDGDYIDLPDVLDYAVEVYADSELLFSRTCIAIYPRLFEWSSESGDPDALLSTARARIQYLGRLEQCTVLAEPGQTITVGARRVWRSDEYRAHIRRTELVAKLPGLFSGM